MSSSIPRVWEMGLIQVDNRSSQFRMEVGNAAMNFEQRRLWEGDLCRLVLKACSALREARAEKDYHPGDLLYCSLAHSINQIIAVVIRQIAPFQPSKEIDLRFPMKDTGAWKSDANLGDVVTTAAWILRPYWNADLSDPELILKVLKDFEILWMEVVSPMFDNRTRPLDQFEGGGSLNKKLLGGDLHKKLTEIRSKIKKARAQQVGGSG